MRRRDRVSALGNRRNQAQAVTANSNRMIAEAEAFAARGGIGHLAFARAAATAVSLN